MTLQKILEVSARVPQQPVLKKLSCSSQSSQPKSDTSSIFNLFSSPTPSMVFAPFSPASLPIWSPAFVAESYPCSLWVNISVWFQLIFGREQASKQAMKWPQICLAAASCQELILLWYLLAPNHSFVIWAVEQNYSPYKCKARVVFWIISDYQILNLWVWYNHCFVILKWALEAERSISTHLLLSNSFPKWG